MRFNVEHSFEAPVDDVERLANSREFQQELEALPNVGGRKVTSLEERADGSMHRVTNYSLGAQLPAPVVALLGKNATWDEIADYDASTKRWTFTIQPHVFSDKLDVKGTYAFEENTPTTSKRVVEAHIKVKVPFVGSRAEKEIAKGLRETLEAEAALLTERLNG